MHLEQSVLNHVRIGNRLVIRGIVQEADQFTLAGHLFVRSLFRGETKGWRANDG
ncbi:hypothetical protein NXT3_PB00108 (plasmid) [Sinorhizobium fredii]|uniref:Uncharacterized protein n=1 Tax=Rhizobium fredii TaxID=380 RepID=A0A2L0HBA2_RHIFR|nr:hypothetical protein NXT3_PB00108 [Sinorhizobium fredii]